jgi:hypothetical protein
VVLRRGQDVTGRPRVRGDAPGGQQAGRCGAVEFPDRAQHGRAERRDDELRWAEKRCDGGQHLGFQAIFLELEVEADVPAAAFDHVVEKGRQDAGPVADLAPGQFGDGLAGRHGIVPGDNAVAAAAEVGLDQVTPAADRRVEGGQRVLLGFPVITPVRDYPREGLHALEHSWPRAEHRRTSAGLQREFTQCPLRRPGQ